MSEQEQESGEHPCHHYTESVLAALRVAVFAAALFVLYFYGLGDIGLIGPDEPRYASIGREMSFSGDWITPQLWGEPWFEKPPLEYWGIGAAFTLGLDDSWASRVFNAVLGSLFVVFFWWVLSREFSRRAAFTATAILATSAAWIAESRIAAMDLPLTVTFSMAMLLAWQGSLVWAAAMLALAVLAKGLVPLVLVLPALWFLRYRWRELGLPLIVFLALVQPWYIAMTVIHGRAFIDEFFIRHHFARFANDSLQHGQPFWFFVPVLLAGIFPWTPLAGLLRWPKDNPKRQFFLVWVLWALIFFSISKNKLPGYILPAVPPLAALLGVALTESKRAWAWCAACGAMLGLTAIIGDVLPVALASGLSRATIDIRYIPALLIAIGGIATGVWQRARGVALVTAVIVPLLILRTYPAMEEQTSVRSFWKSIEDKRSQVCVDTMHRSWRYGLNFYTIDPLPDCSQEAKPIRITQQGSRPPQILVEPQTKFRAPATNPGPGVF